MLPTSWRVRATSSAAALLVCLPTALPAEQRSCPFCAEAAALVSRFELRETEAPVRERAGWTVPRRVITVGGAEWAELLRTAAPGVEVIGVATDGEALAVLGDADVYVGPCNPEILERVLGSPGSSSRRPVPIFARRRWRRRSTHPLPNVAGDSDRDSRRVLLIAAENLRRYESGERMLSVVDPRRGY